MAVPTYPDLAAIVLAGGRSSRMGTAKAGLDWHGIPLLRRVTGILQRLAAPVVVVHALCLLYTSPSPRDISGSRMPSSA